MLLRIAAVCTCVFATTSAISQELRPEEARAFVVGKLFAYNCFDGTAGVGRIFADGSVIGTIRPNGQGAMRYAQLPPGTIKVTSSSVCAHLSGMPLDPCFKIEKLDHRSFRGSLWGMGFAYCDFRQSNPRTQLTSANPAPPSFGRTRGSLNE
jgi:hypothetical protein